MINTRETMQFSDFTEETFEHRYPVDRIARRCRVVVDRFPNSTVDDSPDYAIAEAALEVDGLSEEAIGLIHRVSFETPDGVRLDTLHREEIEIALRDRKPTPGRIPLPFDFTGLILPDDPETPPYRFSLNLDQSLLSSVTGLGIRLRLVGRRVPGDRPTAYRTHQFAGSEIIPPNQTRFNCPLSFRGLVKSLDLITHDRIRIRRLIHDDYGFIVSAEPTLLDDERLWYRIEYDQPLNYHRFSDSHLCLEREKPSDTQLVVNIYAEVFRFHDGRTPITLPDRPPSRPSRSRPASARSTAPADGGRKTPASRSSDGPPSSGSGEPSVKTVRK